MHVIIQNHIESLLTKFDHNELSDSKKFELLANYCCVSKHFLGRFDPIEVTTEEDDASIDGIAIIIDGELIRCTDDAEEIFNTHKTNLTAEVVLVQSKSGEKFSKEEIANFNIGISDFLSLDPELPNGELNTRSIEILKIIFKNLSKIRNKRPSIFIYYCTSGVYNGEREIAASFEIIKKQVANTDFFNLTEVKPLGRTELIKIYSGINSINEGSLKLIDYFGMPKMPGIPQSYVAIVNAKEFVESLLLDETRNLKQSVFEENVRSYLGNENTVNQAIQETLSQKEKKSLFSVLNNGVTIVAPEITLTPNTKEIKLVNFQIINGCQTSSTLFENQKHLDNSVNLVAKFIESPENYSSTDIISATNSQSGIPQYSFLGLKNKAKLLQKYFEIRNQKVLPENKIYFERRQGEFNNLGHPYTRIFDIREISRCYAAMFLETPHNSSRYISRIFSVSEDNLFKDSDQEAYYYASALALYKYQALIKSRRIKANNYTKLRWHVISIFKFLCHKNIEFPPPNSSRAEKYALKIIDILNSDKHAYIPIFEECQRIINQTGIPSDDAIKRSRYYSDLKEAVKNYLNQTTSKTTSKTTAKTTAKTAAKTAAKATAKTKGKK